MITPRYLTRKEAAAHCGLSVVTFDTAVRPHVPEINVTARPLWDTCDLDRFLSSRKVRPEDAPTLA